MTLAATLNNALSGLNTAQNALSLTAHNIVNANTEGYSRKLAAPETQVVANRGAGVRMAELSRSTDEFLTLEIRRQASVVSEAEVKASFHERVQDLLGSPGDDDDISLRIAELMSDLDGLAASPEVAALRSAVLHQAQAVSDQISQLPQELQRLRGEAEQQIAHAVDQINAELEEIASLNREIERLAVGDQSTAELLDRRDALVRSLSEKIDISTYPRENGALVVQTGAGLPLVDESARVLVYEQAHTVDDGTTFSPLTVYHHNQIDQATGLPEAGANGSELVSSGQRASLSAEMAADGVADEEQLVTTLVRSGRLAGLLEVRDQLLPELDDQIQELASGLRFALNAAHNTGTGLPPPSALAGTNTDLGGFATATRSGTATIAVVDRDDGSTIAAFQVDIGAVADAADLAAAVDADLGGLGSSFIGSDGALGIALADPGQGLAIAEGDTSIVAEDAAGRARTYAFSHYFGMNEFLVRTRERESSLALNPDLLADPARLSAVTLDVAGPPLAATLAGPGDHRPAQAMADALRTGQAVLARGGLLGGTVALASYAGSIISHVSIDARQTTATLASARVLAGAFDLRHASVAGVNVDEEMSRVIELQKSYTVAARLISITEEMFDELFRAAS